VFKLNTKCITSIIADAIFISTPTGPCNKDDRHKDGCLLQTDDSEQVKHILQYMYALTAVRHHNRLKDISFKLSYHLLQRGVEGDWPRQTGHLVRSGH
jgi:hypothetical protein